jgi:DNA-binding phage protein
MAAKGCGMSEMARRCSVSRSALYRKVGGKSPFTVREANMVARALFMTDEEMERIFFAR